MSNSIDRKSQKEIVSMQGKQSVIDALNAGLTIELTGVNQYFVQSKMCRNWGLTTLADKHFAESVRVMKHAEKLIDRIIFLEGVPEIARYDVIRVGGTVEKQFANNVLLETKGVQTYNSGIQICLEMQDAGSRGVMETILVDSERHLDWLEAQIDLISKVGVQNYLAQQIGQPKATP
jgi:bacterioferritin